MPHIDDRSGEVVIRIVYDGAPEAGKTTNVAQLLSQISVQRRGATASPGTMGERTEFFDWLDFTGGYLDGRRVRCQIVSVPGQRSLESRRERLLATADAIVFVVDSSPARLTEALESWNAAERLLASRAPAALAAPVGMVVQVNKQDQPDALTPPEVLRRLGMEETTPAVSSVASAGTGVMETFVLAARLATNRVRALLLEDATLSDLPRVEAAPDALHEAMLDAERVPEDDALDWSIPPAPPEPEPKAEVVPASAPRPIAVPRPQGGRPTAPASFHGDAGPDTTRPTRPVLPAAERPTRPIPAPVIGTRDAGRYSITSAPVEDDPRPPRPPIPKRASDDETTPVQSPAPPPAEPELEIEPEPEPKPKPAPPRPTRPSSDDEVTPVKSPVPEPLEPAPESTTPTVRPAPPAIEPAPPAIELAPPTFEPIEPAPPTFEPIEPAPPTFEPIEPAPPTFEPAPPAIELAPASFEPEAAPTGLLAFLKRLFSWLFGDQAWNR